MRLIPCLVIVLVFARARLAAAAPAGPSDAEVAKITAAAPATSRARPAQPRKLLVFSLSWGYKHDSIPYGKKVAETLAAKTGAFTAVVSDDLANFETPALQQFDAVFFNNTNEEIFLPEDFAKLPAEEKAKAAARDQRLKDNLVAYLKGGKGLAVIHAGVASFRQWPEYGNIIGARFQNHPWVSGSTVTLKIDDPAHPVAQAFQNAPLAIRDEIYQMADPYSRTKLHVLVSLDADKTDMTKKDIVRTDRDFAMAWVKSYGQGRVFYSAFGHDHDIFWNPVVLQHWLDGLQFVLGDLPGDTTPSSK